MVGAGHDRAPAGLAHRRLDLGQIGRDHDRADRGRLGPAQHVHDHRLPGDVGERLARQPGRGHAGGNQDENIGHRLANPSALIRVAKRAANRLFVAPPSFAVAEPFSDEFVRNQQNSRRGAGNLPVPPGRPHRRWRDLHAASTGEARLRGRREGGAAERRKARRRRPPSRSRPCWRAPPPNTARKSPSNARSATICRRAKARRSAPIFMASSDARRPPWPASTTRPR